MHRSDNEVEAIDAHLGFLTAVRLPIYRSVPSGQRRSSLDLGGLGRALSDATGPGGAAPSYQVLIPVSQDKFADFIAGLLGASQTFEKVYRKAFELSHGQVENSFHLIDQRVKQQNEASLIEFSVRVGYDDDSSVLHASLGDFLAYSEVKPLVVTSLQLKWVYLIKFPDRSVPEKQTIELSFQIDGAVGLVHIDDGVHVVPRAARFLPAHIRTRIVHTARTWATDIDSLLEGHIKTLTRDVTGLRSWLCDHSGVVALTTGATFLVVFLVSTYLAADSFVEQQYASIQAFLQASPPPGTDDRVDKLLMLSVNGTWRRFGIVSVGMMIVAIPLAGLLAAWAATSAENAPSSFLLLSERSERRRKNLLQRAQRRWFHLAGALLSSVGSGLLANFLFRWLMDRWVLLT